MRSIAIVGAALLASPAAAQDAAPTKEEAAHASRTLGLIVSALNSKEVPTETKQGIFGCLYERSLSTIAQATKQVLDKNPKVDETDATQQLIVLAGVCGAPMPKPAEAATPAADADDDGPPLGEGR
ncbi:hypothetical protein [Sphingomonas japonica]|nr:hypothetical protein [Sphingomonas japonica]